MTGPDGLDVALGAPTDGLDVALGNSGLARLAAERDRYRAALVRIRDQGLPTYGSGCEWEHWAAIAEKALEAK
ncbi:hypothetical protein [Kineosporia babensis]|uniref:Uncharacterized protein n=1 Tax=Kineosporia babensis TaxID=499548 RepID=A0A9X1ST36_9ACTN|nr:hypothetical protein [Kineosporia babensis]MCD5310886.1 hypothetical protein [Kineosporia babensis]